MLTMKTGDHDSEVWYSLRCDSYEGWNLHGAFRNSDKENGKNKTWRVQKRILRLERAQEIRCIKL